MTAINFPVPTSTPQIFTANGLTWQWNGSVWVSISSISDGYTGSRGDTGFVGSRGAYDAIGFTGSVGYAGSTGYVGSKGDLGYTGSQGAGFTGSKGEQGTAGYTGSQGPAGSFGGAAFEYYYNSSPAHSDPGTGYLSFNNVNLSAATILYINFYDHLTVSTYNFIQTIDDSSSAIKGHFVISDKLNPNNYVMFAIVGNVTSDVTHFDVPVNWLGGVTTFTNSLDTVITFARTGDIGDRGYTGSASTEQGPLGYTGSQGAGYTGSEGDPGPPGPPGGQGDVGEIGYTGSAGSQGDLGYTGSQGPQGLPGGAAAIGYTGSIGDLGYSGSQGYTGSQGSRGYSGSKGDLGYSGSKGDKGDIGYVGSQGDIGYVGSQGAGFTGSKGDTGFVGSQGPAGGYTGSSGYAGSKGESSYTYSTTPPVSPVVGDRWFNTIDGTEVVWTNDGDSIQWVEIAASGFLGLTGYTGSSGAYAGVGYVGSKGDLGYTGSQGAGYTGSRGDIGFTGSVGFVGSQGVGYVGSRGNLGYTGSKGDQGYSGSQGNLGNVGYTGSKGDLGIVGFTGSASTAAGYTGSQGLKVGLDYSFNSATVGTGLIAGKMCYSSEVTNSVTIIYIHSSNLTTDFTNLISTWDDSTNNPRGILTVTDTSNTNSFINVYYITGAITISSNVFSIPVTWVFGDSGPYDGENLKVNFTRVGDNGFTGSRGYTGSQGDKAGIRFNFNTITYSNDNPANGDIRYNNATIGSVNTLYLSNKNADGLDVSNYMSVWAGSGSLVKGQLVITDALNTISFLTVFNITGASAGTGFYTINVAYVAGTLPSSGQNLSVTYIQGGDTGYVGSQGPAGGYTGSRGDTGFVGSQGTIGKSIAAAIIFVG
jgi:hypothetical protein